MRGHLFLIGLVGASAAARAVAACGDGDPAAPPPLPVGPDGEEAGNGTGADSASNGDGEVDGGVDAGPPSFCSGIVFYVTYDNGLRATVGRGPVRSSAGGIGFDAGSFGRALALAPGEAANVNYDIYDGGDAGDADVEGVGVPRFMSARDEGSVAFWYRRAGTTTIQSFVRPYNGASSSSTIPTFGTDGDELGLFADLSSGPLLVVSRSALAPFIHDESTFDHYAGVWRREDVDAGRTPLLRLAVNGGIGAPIDASADAAMYDATPDDAGNFSVPWRAQRTTPFAIGLQPMTNLRIGGLAGTAPVGLIDDLAVWSRALSFEEIAEVYGSGMSIRERCLLP